MGNDTISKVDTNDLTWEEQEKIKKIVKGWGMPVDMSIKKFKKYLASEFPGLKKTERNYLTKRYKERAWQDFDEMVKKPLYMPTRPNYGEASGKQSEQAADLPLAGK